MAKDKPSKLKEIKHYSFELYNKVQFGDMDLQDAYNQMGRELTKTSEYKGTGTRGRNKIGLKDEMDRLQKMYKPKLKEYLTELKRLFPFTFDKDIKDFTDKE